VLLKSICAVSIGAALGALLRWALSEWLNASFPTIPPGTLLSNLIGGYLVGIAIAVFATSTLPLEWRLFIITGFCGGLTTFSTFSAELVVQLQAGRVLWTMAAAAAHLFGSILMTFAGVVTVQLIRKVPLN
jgi:fluoride exporter